MAATFGTRTVTSPDNSVKTIDLAVGEWFMFKLALGVQSGSQPLGWEYLSVSAYNSISGGPSTGNLTQLSTEGLEMGWCQGTDYAPTHSSFYGIGMKAVGTFTGVAPAGTNTYFTKNPWNTFIRSGGSDSAGGNGSPCYVSRDETSSNYPLLTFWDFRHYTTDHVILTPWPMYGVEDWVPLATRRMMTPTGSWAPRDHINLYFNTEKGIGSRGANPTSANIYPTDSAIANLDTIWFRNFMSTGITWRIMCPAVHREYNIKGGT